MTNTSTSIAEIMHAGGIGIVYFKDVPMTPHPDRAERLKSHAAAVRANRASAEAFITSHPTGKVVTAEPGLNILVTEGDSAFFADLFTNSQELNIQHIGPNTATVTASKAAQD